MGTPSIQLRISTEANDALKAVTAKFPKWSLAQLGDTLLSESCKAILGSMPYFPTVDYIRAQIGAPARPQPKVVSLDDPIFDAGLANARRHGFSSLDSYLAWLIQKDATAATAPSGGAFLKVAETEK